MKKCKKYIYFHSFSLASYCALRSLHHFGRTLRCLLYHFHKTAPKCVVSRTKTHRQWLYPNRTNLCVFSTVFSSPEPLGSQGELIVYPWSVVRPSVRRRRRRPQCSNIFFSETAWPIKAKFYVEPPWEGGTKVYINGPGHMTKMAAMPIYGKNPSKIFFSRTGGPIFTKFGM